MALEEQARGYLKEYQAFYHIAPLDCALTVTDLSHFQQVKDAIDLKMGNGLDKGDWLTRQPVSGMVVHDARLTQFHILLVAERLTRPEALRHTVLHEAAHVHTLPRVDYDAYGRMNSIPNLGFHCWSELAAEYHAQQLLLRAHGCALPTAQWLARVKGLLVVPPSHPHTELSYAAYLLACLLLEDVDPLNPQLDLGPQDARGGVAQALQGLMALSAQLLKDGLDQVDYSDIRRAGFRALRLLDALLEQRPAGPAH